MIVTLLNKILDFNLRLHNLGLYIATSQCNDIAILQAHGALSC